MCSLSRRSVVLGFVTVLPLSACGFRPVYAPEGPGLAFRDRVRVQAPVNRLGFELTARLEERLGRGARPDFDLGYTITTRSEGIAITGSNDITRVRIHGTVAYALTETATGAQVLAGRVSSFAAYSTTSTTLATDAAQRDAETRLMVLLADRITGELLAGAARLI